MSLDGFLAGKDDDISWLNMVDREGEDYGYFEFTKDVDTYIVGRKSYDVVTKLCDGEFPPAKQFKTYVLTRQDLTNTGDVTFYNGDPIELVKKIQQEEGGHIYCDGGAQVVKLFIEANLFDEYIVAIIPHLLGDGKRLFLGGTPSVNVVLKKSKQFESGLVQLHYERKPES